MAFTKEFTKCKTARQIGGKSPTIEHLTSRVSVNVQKRANGKDRTGTGIIRPNRPERVWNVCVREWE